MFFTRARSIALFLFLTVRLGGLNPAFSQNQDLNAPSPEERVAAVQSAMRQKRLSSIPALIKAYDLESEASVRTWQVRALEFLSLTERGKSKKPASAAVLTLLASALRDNSPEVRSSAATALGKLGGKGAVNALAGALVKESNEGVRQNILFWLGGLKDPASVPALGKALAEDKDPNVRAQAARSLKWIGNSSAKAELKKAEKDKDERVRKIANER